MSIVVNYEVKFNCKKKIIIPLSDEIETTCFICKRHNPSYVHFALQT